MRRCHACTFENRSRFTICEMCGTMLKNGGGGSVGDLQQHLSNGGGGGGGDASFGVRPPHHLPPRQARAAAASDAAAAAGSPGPSIKRESELMDQLREVEEAEARDRWRSIIEFCKEVSKNKYFPTGQKCGFAFLSHEGLLKKYSKI